jgi:cytochrome c peroxidase
MKKTMLLIGIVLMLLAGIAIAEGTKHVATVERGQALFNDPRLGTSGKTCNDCHKNGQGLEHAGARKDLEMVVNRCVMGPLKGKMLENDSIEMQSIVLYLKSLARRAR